MKKKKENKQIEIKPLTGTDKEKAYQLFNLIKEQEIPVNVLETIVPISVDFVKEFASCIKLQIEYERERDKKYLDIMDRLSRCLSDRLSDNTISESERIEIIKSISLCSHDMSEYNKEKIRSENGFKKFLAACAAGVASVVIIVLGGKGKRS